MPPPVITATRPLTLKREMADTSELIVCTIQLILAWDFEMERLVDVEATCRRK